MKTVKTTYRCSCGCGKVAEEAEVGEPRGWFILHSSSGSTQNDLRLSEPLHFSCLGCLGRWTAAAVAAAPRLESGASERPRSIFTVPGVEGLCV